MASVMARNMDSVCPPATSLPRPARRPRLRYLRMGAMPEPMFMLELGQWATHTPRSRVNSISASVE